MTLVILLMSLVYADSPIVGEKVSEKEAVVTLKEAAPSTSDELMKAGMFLYFLSKLNATYFLSGDESASPQAQAEEKEVSTEGFRTTPEEEQTLQGLRNLGG